MRAVERFALIWGARLWKASTGPLPQVLESTDFSEVYSNKNADFFKIYIAIQQLLRYLGNMIIANIQP